MSFMQKNHTGYKTMKQHTCPSWISFSLDNFLRRLIQDPDRILADFIKPGDTALDLGCGPGFFTVPMAGLVGESGKVIAADIQEKMLAKMRKKAARHDLAGRIKTVLSSPDKINVKEPADFVLTFWMVHEVSNKKNFFSQIAAVMKKKARYLLVEPKMHVSDREYQEIIRTAESSGLKLLKNVPLPLSRSALFTK
jgi:ubiquinone/menaquinone biosynthesis C-methylase UbiE